MDTKRLGYDARPAWHRHHHKLVSMAVFLLVAGLVSAAPAVAADLKAMKTGLGSGTVASAPAGIDCGADCDQAYGSAAAVTLTATPAAGSTFVQWHGDCAGVAPTCNLTMSADRSAQAEFALSAAIPTIVDLTPAGLAAYLTANPTVDSAARFVKALPTDFKQNWILASRSESLQTGTAETPRVLLPSADARFVFTFGLAEHSSYPGAHPDAIEYMQWDAVEKNFRFHEVVLDAIPAMGAFPARSRGVSVDDARCSKCHSTRNVLNPGTFPGTTGIPPGTVKFKNKPNWDTYDSWGGMLPFNRDRIYQGSVEAAAFRRIFNPWTWRGNDAVRSLIEQLELQPPGVSAAHSITRVNGGTNDGHLIFGFDASPPVLTEPAPVGDSSSSIAYAFNGVAGTPPGSSVARGGSFLTLHHSDTPTSDEGRGVQLFDLLGGLDGNLNQTRIADEVASHRFATGSVPIDVRPIALAITKSCVLRDAAADAVTGIPAAAIAFFNARNGMTINNLYSDTQNRAKDFPRRKADIQKLNLDRTGDVYLDLIAAQIGLVQQYGAATSAGTDTATSRIRQEVFRRPTTGFQADTSVMGGVYVDREVYGNTEKVALYRYFLEPLGVSVDKWPMGVRGRSRTYTFADVFGSYTGTLRTGLEASLDDDPFPGLASPYDCDDLVTAVNSSLSALPATDAVPTYTDVQRIFNKGCIECHGGLDYPPFSEFFDANYLDFSEDEAPPAGDDRLDRAYNMAVTFTSTTPATSYLYQRITQSGEQCPNGVMPCGGPPLSKADTETIRRWIVGGRPYTNGDPHIRTVDGTNYDFQSAGEFVLLRGQGVEIQARQSAVETENPLGPNPHTGLSTCVSINTATAIRVGPHRISYQPNPSGEPDPAGLQLRVDGKLMGRIGARGIVLSSGGRILPTTVPGGIQIEYPGGTDIVLTPGWWEYYQLWYLNIDVRHARATEGVMGAVAPRNWLPALPDGSFMGPRPSALHQRYLDIYETFADAWRVSDQSSLFDYAPGTSTASFTIDAWPGESPRSCRLPKDPDGTSGKPPIQPLPLEVAKQHCRAVVEDDRRANCEQDVMVTGEPGFAETYLAAERIQRNAMPAAPTLLTPDNDATNVDRTVRFTWETTADADGGDLTYMHCIWAAGERLTFHKCRDLPAQRGVFTETVFYLLLAALLLCLLIVIVLCLKAKKGRILLIILAVAILAAILLVFHLGRGGTTMSTTVSALEPGKSYFWKVIAEDGQGGTVESETRRFATRK